jgi:hypothetical protein
MRRLWILASRTLRRKMAALFDRRTETDQFDEVLVQRVFQPDDDVFDIFSGICHLHGFIEFHVISPSGGRLSCRRKDSDLDERGALFGGVGQFWRWRAGGLRRLG